MSELKKIAEDFEKILAEKKVEKYTYTFSQSEKQELNVENGGFKLMRTVFSNSGFVKVFEGSRMGSVSGNDLSKEGLEKLATDGILAAQSAQEDPCHDFGPDQGKDVFRQGVYEPDMGGFLDRVKEFLATVEKEYPKVKIMQAIGSFDRWNWFSRNTNGTEFEGIGGQYGFSCGISANDGEQTTGIDFFGFSLKDLNTPFIEMTNVRMHLENIQRSLDPQPVEGKFEGTVLLTPDCASQFINMTLYNYAGSSVIIDGTGLWLEKVGEKVVDERLTVTLDPFDERIIMGERGTQDGYRSETVKIIDKGVLKTHLLNLYAANKTGRPMMKNTGSDLVVEPGDKSFEELVKSIDKGLLLGGFSGGQPGANGEFSGVAKNSFLIENGKIKCAVTETMVNGNLGEALNHIHGISKELICDGGSVVPYIALDGIVISGK